MLEVDEAKTAFNARVKVEMDEFLRSKTWAEKVESIERMNVADKIAKRAMRKALSAVKPEELAFGDSTPGFERGE